MADTDPSLYSLRYNQASSNLEAFGGGSPQWTQITLNNVDPQQVPITRLINTTSPLVGGGNLSADRTISIPQATSSVNGFLLAADWINFNGKLSPALPSADIFVGNGSNVAAGVPLSGDATLTNTGILTLNSVNANVGSFTNTAITVDVKGRITAASSGVVGNLTDAGTDGITITNGVGAVLGTGTSISQHVADTTHNGYLSSTDWNTFNNKESAVLTNTHIFVGNASNVPTDVALSGDATLANTGALTLATVNGNVGSFANATVTVNAKGLITAASTGSAITALTGDVTASGPGSATATLATVNGNVGSFTNASLTVNAKGLITAASSGTAPVTSVSGTANDISSTGGTTPVLDLVNTAVTPATYTYTTFTVDAKGRLTAASSGTAPVTSVSGTTNQITSTGGTTPVLAIANPVTFPGAMTAGGALAMGANKITGLANGTVSTDAAAFGQVPVSTDWVAYTPTIVGCGTVTSNTAYWRQIGNHIFVKGFFTTGTVTSTSMTISLPNSTTINTAHVSASFALGIGYIITNSGSAALLGANGYVAIFTDGSTNSTVFGAIQSQSNLFVKNQGGQLFSNNFSLSYSFDYPI